MRARELVRQHSVLKALIRRAGHDASTHDLEMLAHWGKYICVLIAGFIENCVRATYVDYVLKTSSPQTGRFAALKIEGIQNPKAIKLVEIARSFDPEWGRELNEFLEVNFRKDAIDSIMTNRHLIAHGRNSTVTLAQVEQYLMRIAEVAEYLEKQCGR